MLLTAMYPASKLSDTATVLINAYLRHIESSTAPSPRTASKYYNVHSEETVRGKHKALEWPIVLGPYRGGGVTTTNTSLRDGPTPFAQDMQLNPSLLAASFLFACVCQHPILARIRACVIV